MLRALNTSATGMASQEANINTVANNVANVNTVGFKKGRAEFEDLLYETIEEAGGRSSATSQYNTGLQIGSGSKVSGVRKIHSQGDPMITKNPFDLMINGDGHFGIIMPSNEIRYTRDGSFGPDQNGVLVNKQGFRLFPTITLPPQVTSVNIAQDGTVEAYLQGQVEPQNAGVISVFTFINPAGLYSTGGNLYKATGSSGAPIQMIGGQQNAGIIEQGMLESSNVSIMNEMTDMIKAQRSFEMNSKVMNIADQILQTVNNVR